MSFLSASNGSTKLDLIRILVAKRIEMDPHAAAAGFTPEMARSIDVVQLLGTVEASIVTMVEAFNALISSGCDEGRALEVIEAQREKLAPLSGRTFRSLAELVEVRAAAEHTGPTLPTGFPRICLQAAKHFFSRSQPKGAAAHALGHALHEVQNQKYNRVMEGLSSFLLDGVIGDEQLYDLIGKDVEEWRVAQD